MRVRMMFVSQFLVRSCVSEAVWEESMELVGDISTSWILDFLIIPNADLDYWCGEI